MAFPSRLFIVTKNEECLSGYWIYDYGKCQQSCGNFGFDIFGSSYPILNICLPQVIALIRIPSLYKYILLCLALRFSYWCILWLGVSICTQICEDREEKKIMSIFLVFSINQSNVRINWSLFIHRFERLDFDFFLYYQLLFVHLEYILYWKMTLMSKKKNSLKNIQSISHHLNDFIFRLFMLKKEEKENLEYKRKCSFTCCLAVSTRFSIAYTSLYKLGSSTDLLINS